MINSLRANRNNFQSIIISSNAQKHNDLQMEVNDNVIAATSSLKISGIHIVSKRNFNGHIAFLEDHVCRITIYNSFISSNFTYCTVCMGVCQSKKSSVKKPENIQKRALRFARNYFVSNNSELLENLVLMTLRYMATKVYRCVNNINPQY